jgi:uncharacterized protein YjbJ (UPF0337 family)
MSSWWGEKPYFGVTNDTLTRIKFPSAPLFSENLRYSTPREARGASLLPPGFIPGDSNPVPQRPRSAPEFRTVLFSRHLEHLQRLTAKRFNKPRPTTKNRRAQDLQLAFVATPTAGMTLSLCKEIVMNWDTVKGNWTQYKGKIKEQWGKLTDDHLDMIDGQRDQLAGKIQEAYGVTKDEAEQQIRGFEDRTRH